VVHRPAGGMTAQSVVEQTENVQAEVGAAALQQAEVLAPDTRTSRFLASDLTLVHSFEVPHGGADFYRTFLADDAHFLLQWHRANGGTIAGSLSVTPWRRPSVCRDSGGEALQREQAFTVHIGRFFANRSRAVEKQQWRPGQHPTDAHHWEARNQLLDIPFADTFIVEFRVDVHSLDATSWRIECWAGLHFVKENLFARQIQRGTIDQYVGSFRNMENLVRRALAARASLSSPMRVCKMSVLHSICSRGSKDDGQKLCIALRDTSTGGFLSLPSASSNQLAVLPEPEDMELCKWELWSVDAERFALRSIVSGRWIGHNLVGQIHTAARKCGAWEHVVLEESSNYGAVHLIDADWHFKRGAYFVYRSRGSSYLACSSKGREAEARARSPSFQIYVMEPGKDVRRATATKQRRRRRFRSKREFLRIMASSLFFYVMFCAIFSFCVALGAQWYVSRYATRG